MRLKIGSTYQKAVTIIEKLKEGNASIFICGKSGTGKTTLSSDIIIRNLLESGVRIVVIRSSSRCVSASRLRSLMCIVRTCLKSHSSCICLEHQQIPQMPLHLSLIRLHPSSGYQMAKAVTAIPTRKGSP